MLSQIIAKQPRKTIREREKIIDILVPTSSQIQWTNKMHQKSTKKLKIQIKNSSQYSL
jgi:hypothetical protein